MFSFPTSFPLNMFGLPKLCAFSVIPSVEPVVLSITCCFLHAAYLLESVGLAHFFEIWYTVCSHIRLYFGKPALREMQWIQVKISSLRFANVLTGKIELASSMT